MPTIKNTTKKPMSVPLPGGKRLFLGPGKEGRIGARADEHPSVVALVEAGELEIVSDADKPAAKAAVADAWAVARDEIRPRPSSKAATADPIELLAASGAVTARADIGAQGRSDL